MMMDILVLLKFLKYLYNLDALGYGNSWINNYHDPLLTSIQLDQVLLPLFLEISLQGVCINETALDQVFEEKSRPKLCSKMFQN